LEGGKKRGGFKRGGREKLEGLVTLRKDLQSHIQSIKRGRKPEEGEGGGIGI